MSAEDYRRGKQLLAEGHVLEAIDHFRRALLASPGDTRLEYGLMLARSRATPGSGLWSELGTVLARADLPPDWRWQFMCVQAKLLKSAGEREPARLAESAALYLAAHRLSGDSYPGVNAASLLALCGREEESAALAASLLAGLPAGDGEDYWLAATRGELCVLLAREDEAERAYAVADRLSAGHHGDRASIRRQLQMLAARRPAACARILSEAFPQPHVSVFSGHRLDRPGAPAARFPADRIDRVRAALERFAKAHAGGLSYSSAASGGDILFIEAMLARGTQAHIVLPVPPEQFVEESVRDAGSHWTERFGAVLARATRVVVAHHAVSEVPAALYHYTNLLSDGLAQLHADAIDGRVSHLAVLHAHSLAPTVGGTRHEVERWHGRGYRVEIVDPLPEAGAASPPAPAAPGSAAGEEPGLAVRAMLFADLVGSSRFAAEDIPRLLGHFLGEARRLIDSFGLRPRLRNTWGDGLFLVFDRVEDAARLASALARDIAWPQQDAEATPAIRVSLHAGPVMELHDAILDRSNVFGHHVIRAARVEPVTPPGEVFATEEAAALLRATGESRFDCVYMGRISMPKGFGETPIYRIDAPGRADPGAC